MKYLLLVGSEGLAAPQETAVMQREIPGWAEVLVSDGPFAEAKEWIAGFDLVECADLDEAIEVAAAGPVSRFKTIEIRAFADGPWLGEAAAAFGPGDQAVTREAQAWRQDLQARGLHILGAELKGADTATTLRVRGGKTLLGDGTFIKTGEFITGIDIVSCADRQQATQLAAAHPAARYHPIEVRPFQSG